MLNGSAKLFHSNKEANNETKETDFNRGSTVCQLGLGSAIDTGANYSWRRVDAAD